MALPFIAGALLGGLAVVAFNNKDKIKTIFEDGLDKSKDFANDVKKYAQEKFEEAATEVKKRRKRRTSEEVAAEKAAKEAAKGKTKRKRRAKKQTVPKAQTTAIEASSEQLEPQSEE